MFVFGGRRKLGSPSPTRSFFVYASITLFERISLCALPPDLNYFRKWGVRLSDILLEKVPPGVWRENAIVDLGQTRKIKQKKTNTDNVNFWRFLTNFGFYRNFNLFSHATQVVQV